MLTNKPLLLPPSESNLLYNPLVSQNDSVILFRSYINDTENGMIIGPWSSNALGMKMDGRSGYIGVGTSNPREMMDVAGSLAVGSNIEIGGDMVCNRVLVGDDTDSAVYPSYSFKANRIMGMFHASNNNLGFATKGEERMRINDKGYVGIGVGSSNPREVMDVSGGNMKVASNIYAGARLGVGTSNPDVGLVVNTTDAVLLPRGSTGDRPTGGIQGYVRYNTSLGIFEGYGVGNTWGSLGGIRDINGDTYISAESFPGSNDDILRFYTSNNEVMRIAANGFIGMSNGVPGERLDVAGGNAKFGSNIYCMGRLGVGTSNLGNNSNSVVIDGGSGIVAVAFSNTGGGNLQVGLAYGAGDYSTSAAANDGVIRNTATNGKIILQNGVGAVGLVVNSNNSVGIGTNIPSVSLEVNGAVKVGSNLEVGGNLIVRGTTTTVDSTTVNIADNIIRLNNGAAFNSSLQAGIEVNRGVGLSNYYFVFDEVSDYFKVGMSGGLQTVATRDDSIGSNAIAIYNAGGNRYTGCNDLVYSGGQMGVGLANPVYKLDVAGDINYSGTLRKNGVAFVGSTWSDNAGSLYIVGGSNIGIGTSNVAAGAVLHVVGGAFRQQVTANIGTGKLLGAFGSTTANRVEIYDELLANNLGPRIYFGAANTSVINSGGNIAILPSNNLGVGVSNPGYRLDVLGDINFSGVLRQNGASVNLGSVSSQWSATGANVYLLGSNVGIGTATPAHRLDVSGSMRVSGATISAFDSGAWIDLPTNGPSGLGTGGAGTDAWIAYAAGAGQYFASSLAADICYRNRMGRLLFGTNGIQHNVAIAPNYFYSSNNVGIGTSNVTNALTVAGGGSIGSGYTGNASPANGLIVQGNVGIGTTAPGFSLDVAGTTRIQNTLFMNSQVQNCVLALWHSNIPSAATTEYFGFGINNGVLRYNVNVRESDHVFYANTTELMRVKGTGLVGIGLSNPLYNLHVASNAMLQGVFANNNYQAHGRIYFNDRNYGIGAGTFTTSGTDNLYLWRFDGDNRSIVFTRTSNGNTNPAGYTVDMIIYGNTGFVGIGTATPSHTLDIAGSLRVTSNITTPGSLITTNASGLSAFGVRPDSAVYLSAVAPYIASSTDNPALPNTSSNARPLYFYGSNITYDARFGNHYFTTGNVGIGNSNPGSALFIARDSQLSNTTFAGDPGQGQFFICGSTDINKRLAFLYDTTTNRGYIQSLLRFSGATPLCLNSAGGNVGIGTSNPIFQLHNALGSVFIGDITYASNVIPASVPSSTTANGHRLIFDNSYNGTPGTGMAANKIVLHNNNFIGGFGIEESAVTYHSGSAHNFYVSACNTNTYGNIGMSLTTTGLGIGTSNTNSYKLNVIGTCGVSHYIQFPNIDSGKRIVLWDGGSGAYNGIGKDPATTTFSISTTDNYFKYVAYNLGTSNEIMRLTGAGNLGIGTSNPGYRLEVSGAIYSSGDITAFSDKRMKDDLKPIINALDKVEKMQGYTYVRKDYDALNEKMGRRHLGFVAQELVDVVPEAVLYDEGSDRFSVNYGSLVAVCVEAIKELRRENRELRDIIAKGQ